MLEKNRYYKNAIYIVPIVIALAQFLLFFVMHVDGLFFTYERKTYYYYIVKFMYLLYLIGAWCLLFYLFQKVKEKNADVLRGIQIFLFYFIIQVVLLMILWPGTWCYDDLLTLNKIENYNTFDAWQNVITGIYQDVLLQTIPLAGG